mgnify:CR=1 FL=1
MTRVYGLSCKPFFIEKQFVYHFAIQSICNILLQFPKVDLVDKNEREGVRNKREPPPMKEVALFVADNESVFI